MKRPGDCCLSLDVHCQEVCGTRCPIVYAQGNICVCARSRVSIHHFPVAVRDRGQLRIGGKARIAATPSWQATQSNIRAFAPLWINGKRYSLYLAGLCTDLHNIIAAALDQLPVVGDHENGPAVPRFAFQPFCDQAHILPVKAAGGLVKD